MDSTNDSTPADAPAPPSGLDSSHVKRAPRLSHRSLTWTLIGMCLVPLIVLSLLWGILPPPKQGKLKAQVSAAGLPPAEYYSTEYFQRPQFTGGELVVTNAGDQEWTHLNIRVNDGNYQIYDVAPVPAGATARFGLEKFITRNGDRFKLQYNQLKNVQIFGRLPTRERASFFHKFETVPEP